MSDDIDLGRRFRYHVPSAENYDAMAEIREAFFGLAAHVHKACPPGRERSLAFTKLEEAMFWANAALARPTE